MKKPGRRDAPHPALRADLSPLSQGEARSGWLIAGVVLIPFAGLVFAGFWFTSATPEPVQVEPSPVLATQAPPGAPPVRPAAPLPLPKPLDTVDPVTATITQQVEQCLQDRSTREVQVHFLASLDGGAVRRTIASQDPYVTACLEDVFAETPWEPRDPQGAPATTWTFRAGPPEQ